MNSPLDNLCGPNKPLAAEPPDAAEFAGLKCSCLARLCGISEAKMLECLTSLGRNIEIVV